MTAASQIPAHADIVVIGAGPAGSTAARLLAEWGFEVLLLTGPRRAARRQAESLPPSTRALIETLGLRDAIAGAGFLRSTGNTVWWGDGEPRIERFAAAARAGGEWPGYQVPRGAFDDLLLDLAERAGARVVHGGTVRDVDLGERAGDGEATVTGLRRGSAVDVGHERGPDAADVLDADTPVRGAGVHGAAPAAVPAREQHARVWIGLAGRAAADIVLRARFVIDASGRTGVIARRGWRRDEPGHQTVALAAAWRAADGWPLPDETHTLVEAFDEGWAWSIPVSRAVRFFTVMVDRGAWRSGARGYADAIDRTRHLKALLAHGIRDAAPWGTDASLHDAVRCAGPNVLLTGDAATTLDPLSSFGVKKALASAWMAAIVANTSLTRPARAAAARELFEAREREMYDAGLAGVVAFAREAVQAYPTSAFWRARAETSLDGRVIDSFEERCARDPALPAAFERLRATEGARLQADPAARVAPRPTIDEREVVLADALLLPSVPDGIRFFHGINLPALIEIARARPRDVPALFAAYQQAEPAADLRRLLAALALLVAQGALKIV